MTEQDQELLNTRVVKPKRIEHDIPKSCIRLFATNSAVYKYNAKRIEEQKGTLYNSTAIDKIIVNSKFEEDQKEEELQNYKLKSK